MKYSNPYSQNETHQGGVEPWRVSFWVAALVLGVIAQTHAIADKTSDFVRVDFVKKTREVERAEQVYSGTFCEVWVFSDVLSSRQTWDLHFTKTLIQAGKDFDSMIYPRMVEVIQDKRAPKTPVILIFDNIRDQSFYQAHWIMKEYKGFFDPDFPDQILVDVNFGWNGLEGLRANVLHELTHLLHFQHNPREDDFVREGIAGLLEWKFLGLVNVSSILAFLKNPSSKSVFDLSRRELRDYGAALLLFAYLHEHFGGMELISRFVKQNTSHGLAGLNEAIKSVNGENIDLNYVFRHFCFAILLNTKNFSESGLFSLQAITSAKAFATSVNLELHPSTSVAPRSAVYYGVTTGALARVRENLETSALNGYVIYFLPMENRIYIEQIGTTESEDIPTAGAVTTLVLVNSTELTQFLDLN